MSSSKIRLCKIANLQRNPDLRTLHIQTSNSLEKVKCQSQKASSS